MCSVCGEVERKKLEVMSVKGHGVCPTFMQKTRVCMLSQTEKRNSQLLLCKVIYSSDCRTYNTNLEYKGLDSECRATIFILS